MSVIVLRLFSTFTRSWPGVGLLLLRVIVGVALVGNRMWTPHDGHLVEAVIVYLATTIGALFLILGLWTCNTGMLVAAVEIWRIISPGGDRWISILLAAQCLALALLGPGAWSIDAYLFGWKRIHIRSPKR